MSEAYRRIGQGFCGSVWAASSMCDSSHAIKREDGGTWRSLENDYKMHLKILRDLHLRSSKIHVPDCYKFVRSDDRAWWTENSFFFPEEYRIPCNVLITQRIPPFPKPVRDTLIDLYCKESLRPQIKISEPDTDCLIRPYLGRRRRPVTDSRFQAFSLRNFPLHADQMEDLALDVLLYAKIMAETLADLYWRAEVDADDIEFVLAPSVSRATATNNAASSSIVRSSILGDHQVWILDFDCCRSISMDEEGVAQAVKAFWKNDPYYPRSDRQNCSDEKLWKAFRDHFIETSGSILQGTSKASLAALWIDMIEHRDLQ